MYDSQPRTPDGHGYCVKPVQKHVAHVPQPVGQATPVPRDRNLSRRRVLTHKDFMSFGAPKPRSKRTRLPSKDEVRRRRWTPLPRHDRVTIPRPMPGRDQLSEKGDLTVPYSNDERRGQRNFATGCQIIPLVAVLYSNDEDEETKTDCPNRWWSGVCKNEPRIDVVPREPRNQP